MKQNNVKINFIYNIIYQILTIIIPLITAPYIARVLGPTGSGINSYTHSIVYYFVIVGMLGINNYGNRLIAKVRENSEELNKTFSSLFATHVIVSLIVCIFYFISVFLFFKEYQLYFLIQGIYMLSVPFDINWLFYGLEKFKITVTRNIIIRIISTILIFVLIKDSNDLWLYILILNLSTAVTQLSLYPFLKSNNIRFTKVSIKEIISHIKPLLILFLPTFALTLYKSMDKIMIEMMVNVSEVGMYEYAERIVTLPTLFIIALGTVMLPRISNLLAQQNEEKVFKYIDKSIEFGLFLAAPMCIGLISIANNFIPIFLGYEYNKSIYLLQILSVSIPFISLTNIIQTQYLIPKEKDKEYIIALFLGAIVNLILNLLLIQKINSIGACIATVISEFTVMSYQFYKVKEEFNISKIVKTFFKFFAKAIAMGMIIFCINFINLSNFTSLIIKLIIGIISYYLLNFNYVNKILNLKIILKKVFCRKDSL